MIKIVLLTLQKKKLLEDQKTLPEWTKGESAITTPLKLPDDDKDVNDASSSSTNVECRCFVCDEKTFILEAGKERLLQHLLEAHHVIIADVNLVADLPLYMEYYANKLRSGARLSEFCATVRANVERKEGRKSKADATEESFHMLSDALAEDRELRIKLQMSRLEQVLELQERERRDDSFSRTCLFCRSVINGRAGDFLNHMAKDHNFNVGHPHNLVFINELIDVLEDKLENFICFFCEGVFKNRDVLKEHMRKKGHKKINPRNTAYDKYYLVNYLEMGKKWNAGGNHEEDELPTGFESDSSTEQEATWSDWKGDAAGAVCLFCAVSYADMDELFTHMTSIHDFDFNHIRNSLKLSFYRQVKLVNYIRRQVHLKRCIFCFDSFEDSTALLKHAADEDHMKVPEDTSEWDQPDYYFPTFENDNLLHRLDDDVYESKEEPPVQSEDLPKELEDSVLSQEELRNAICPPPRK